MMAMRAELSSDGGDPRERANSARAGGRLFQSEPFESFVDTFQPPKNIHLCATSRQQHHKTAYKKMRPG